MRTILCLLLAGLAALLGFARAGENNAAAAGLIGKWRLVEYYVDIGDGKGHLHWQKAGDEAAEILEFKDDGHFFLTTTAPQRQETEGAYKLEAGKGKVVTIRFTAKKAAAKGGATTWSSTILVLKADNLELAGPGIEGSGRRYARIQ